MSRIQHFTDNNEHVHYDPQENLVDMQGSHLSSHDPSVTPADNRSIRALEAMAAMRPKVGVEPSDLVAEDMKLILDPDCHGKSFKLPYVTTVTCIHGAHSLVSLPEEVVYYILSLLPLHSLVRCMRVCQHWNNFILNTRGFWLDFYSGDSDRNINQQAAEIYLNRAGQNGLRKISLDSSSALLLNKNRILRLILANGVGNLQHLNMGYWQMPDDLAVQILQEAHLSLRYLNITNMTTSCVVWLTAVQKCEVLEYFEYLRYDMSPAKHEPLPVRNSMKTFRFRGPMNNEADILTQLRLYPNLEEASLEYNELQQPLYLYKFIIELPMIRRLNVRFTGGSRFVRRDILGPAKLDMETVEKITNNSSHLESLSFSTFSPSGACDAQLHAIITGCCTRLSTFELSSSTVSDTTMHHIASVTLPNLQTLKLARCNEITVDSLILAIRACPKLRKVELSCIPALTDRLLECLGESKCLETINIAISHSQPSVISGKGLRSLVTATKSIRKLWVIGYQCFDLDSIAFARSILGGSSCIFS